METLNLLTKETRKIIKGVGGKSIFENYLGGIGFEIKNLSYDIAKTKKGFSLWHDGRVILRGKTIALLLNDLK